MSATELAVSVDVSAEVQDALESSVAVGWCIGPAVLRAMLRPAASVYTVAASLGGI